MCACTVAGELMLLDGTFCHLAAVKIHRVAAEDPQIWCNLLRDTIGLLERGFLAVAIHAANFWLQRCSTARRTSVMICRMEPILEHDECASAHLQLSKSILDDMVSHASHQI